MSFIARHARRWFFALVACAGCNSLFDIQKPLHDTSSPLSCTLTSDCPTGQNLVCLFSRCSEPCHSDVDCASGLRCLYTDAGTACVSATPSACETDGGAPCPSGTECVNDACYAACSDAAPCMDGHACVNGSCTGTGVDGFGDGGSNGQAGGAGGTGNASGSVAVGGDAGASASACEGHGVRCSAHGIPQHCISGYWVDQPACPDSTPVCADGSCVPCQIDAKRCAAANSYQTCSAEGTWGSATPCADGFCNGDGVCGKCAAKSARCSGNDTQTCSTDGTWAPPSACPGGFCNGDGVCGECAKDAARCSSNGTQTCSASGTWNGVSACIGGFCNGAGLCGVCSKSSKQCAGNSIQTCTDVGQWDATTAACNNQACKSGACVGSCTPNTFACGAGISQVCSPDGTLVSTGSTATCYCTAPGRYTKTGSNLVLDSKTGLTWESTLRPSAIWSAASLACDGVHMRLPTFDEWKALIIPVSGTGSTCAPRTVGTAPPFDSVALPTAQNGGLTLWTGQPSTGIDAGYIFVALLGFSQGVWTASMLDQQQGSSLPYRCVSP